MLKTTAEPTSQAADAQRAAGFFYRAVAAAIFMIALLYVATFAVLWDKGGEMSALKAEIAGLSGERAELQSSIASARTPAALAARAEALGMTEAEGSLYYFQDQRSK